MEDTVGINAKGMPLLYMISARIRGLSLSVIGLTQRFFHVFGVLLYVFLTLNETVQGSSLGFAVYGVAL